VLSKTEFKQEALAFSGKQFRKNNARNHKVLKWFVAKQQIHAVSLYQSSLQLQVGQK
jgi:hypothetical protein